MGIEGGLDMVLAGVTTREQAERFPYRRIRILESVADLEA